MNKRKKLKGFKKIKTRTSEWLQFCFFRVLSFVVNALPFSWAMAIGRWGGRMLYYLLPRYQKVAMENLRHAFGREKSEVQIKQIALQAFENLGFFAIEFICIPKIAKQLDQYVLIQNQKSVFKALEGGRGVVLIVSHFGNWEWMGVAAGAKAQEMEIRINAVARPLGNPFLYQYIKRLRGITGLKTVDKRGAAREAMTLLEQNQIVCILIDQHERYGSVPIPYFGRMAYTTALPAMLAVKKDVPVIPVFCYRRKNQPSLVELGEPFPVIRTNNYEQDLFENTKQYVQAIEAAVRKRPGDWLWMHRRWR